ncbi:hypothetical protein CP03DC35_0719A, partial [Chlamydia psittaci 03DC35]
MIVTVLSEVCAATLAGAVTPPPPP